MATSLVTPESPLSSLLSCSVCLEQYTDPKILPCHHSFCQNCLDLLPRERDSATGNYGVKCPTCRKNTPVPNGGMRTFPPSFLLNNLLELKKNREQTEETNEAIQCQEHDKPFEIYCEDCEVAICHHCLVRKHPKHNHCLITDRYHKQFQCVSTMVEQLRKVMVQLEKTAKELEHVEERLLKQQRVVEDSINADADHQIMKINQRRQQLLKQANSSTERKLEFIRFQQSESTDKFNQLRSCEKSVEDALKEGSKCSFVESQKEMVGLIESTLTRMELDTLSPAEKVDLMYHPLAVNNDYLGVVKGTFVNESFRGANETIVAVRNQKQHIVVYNESTDIPVLKPSTKIFSYQLFPAKGMPLEETRCCKAEYHDDLNMCQVYFVPKTCGLNYVAINVGGYPITGSPFPVYVFPPLKLLKTIHNLQSPRGIAVRSDGTLVVTENTHNRVHVFYPNGRRKSNFECPKPVGVAITPDGFLLIADELNRLVKKFTFDGEIVQELENSLTSSMRNPLARTRSIVRTNTPQGITVFPDGRVVVTETGTGTLYEMDSNLSLLSHKKGLVAPMGVAIDSKGNIFITSKSNHNITKYNMTTGRIETFSGKGSSEGLLKRPMDLAIDKNDMIYVADTDNHRVSVFNSDGQFVTCFGEKGEFNEPCAVAVDNEGKLYVCDIANNSVNIYQ